MTTLAKMSDAEIIRDLSYRFNKIGKYTPREKSRLRTADVGKFKNRMYIADTKVDSDVSFAINKAKRNVEAYKLFKKDDASISEKITYSLIEAFQAIEDKELSRFLGWAYPYAKNNAELEKEALYTVRIYRAFLENLLTHPANYSMHERISLSLNEIRKSEKDYSSRAQDDFFQPVNRITRGPINSLWLDTRNGIVKLYGAEPIKLELIVTNYEEWTNLFVAKALSLNMRLTPKNLIRDEAVKIAAAGGKAIDPPDNRTIVQHIVSIESLLEYGANFEQLRNMGGTSVKETSIYSAILKLANLYRENDQISNYVSSFGKLSLIEELQESKTIDAKALIAHLKKVELKTGDLSTSLEKLKTGEIYSNSSLRRAIKIPKIKLALSGKQDHSSLYDHKFEQKLKLDYLKLTIDEIIYDYMSEKEDSVIKFYSHAEIASANPTTILFKKLRETRIQAAYNEIPVLTSRSARLETVDITLALKSLSDFSYFIDTPTRYQLAYAGNLLSILTTVLSSLPDADSLSETEIIARVMKIRKQNKTTKDIYGGQALILFENMTEAKVDRLIEENSPIVTDSLERLDSILLGLYFGMARY